MKCPIDGRKMRPVEFGYVERKRAPNGIGHYVMFSCAERDYEKNGHTAVWKYWENDWVRTEKRVIPRGIEE